MFIYTVLKDNQFFLFIGHLGFLKWFLISKCQQNESENNLDFFFLQHSSKITALHMLRLSKYALKQFEKDVGAMSLEVFD